MIFKQRLYIGVILTVLIGCTMFVAKDNYAKDYSYFLLALLAGIGIYLLLYYVFQKSTLKPYWTSKTDRIIIFFTLVAMLIFGINMSNRVDEEQPSFWVVNGNRWLTDVFASIIAFLFFYVLVSWIFKQWQKIQKIKSEKSIAELSLLKNQINPHFFFNTLNNLYSLIKKDPDTAQEYVLKLSEMMRFTIYKGKEKTVSLKEEINYLNNFIELQTARYHKNIEIDFKQEIGNPNHEIPPLLFIILLENSFKHGVESLLADAFIHIELTENESKIVFEIKNNFDADELSKTSGIGLKNLKERLLLLYPNRHKITITSRDNIYYTKLELSKI